MFSSRIFMVSSLTFKSSVHFEFVLVCGVRRWSSFTFSHVSAQFSQYHLLKRLSLPHCTFLPPLSNINWPYSHGLISGLFYSIDVYICYANTMLFWLLWSCSIVWYQVVWYLQLCSSFSRFLSLFGSFVVSYKFWVYLS